MNINTTSNMVSTACVATNFEVAQILLFTVKTPACHSLGASCVCMKTVPVLRFPARLPVTHVSRRRRLYTGPAAPSESVYSRQQLLTPTSSAVIAAQVQKQQCSAMRSSAQRQRLYDIFVVFTHFLTILYTSHAIISCRP